MTEEEKERLELLERQNFELLLLVLQLAEGVSNLSELFIKHMDSSRNIPKEQLN
jgi:hypothetical protein